VVQAMQWISNKISVVLMLRAVVIDFVVARESSAQEQN
jgi:hypothetical protein